MDVDRSLFSPKKASTLHNLKLDEPLPDERVQVPFKAGVLPFLRTPFFLLEFSISKFSAENLQIQPAHLSHRFPQRGSRERQEC